MLDVALSLLPVFGLIALGAVLGRTRLLTAEGWHGLERLNYWVLFPALLFGSIVTAELEGGEASRLAVAVAVSDIAIAVLLLVARPLLGLPGPAFSSVFQGAIRWNGYVGLGVVASVLGEE